MSIDDANADQVPTRQELLLCMTRIVAAFGANNHMLAEKLPGLMQAVFQSLNQISADDNAVSAKDQAPAVSIRKSVRPDYLVCLEDGRQFKTLKRHLHAEHDLTPKEYREKWGLPSDYPMVASDYAERRSAVAKSIGLGQRKGT